MKNEYRRLDFNKKDEFSKAMKDMLAVYDNHCIYVCHPRSLFTKSQDIEDVDKIKWNKVSIQKMFKDDNYESFVSFQENEAFHYIHNRLGTDVMETIEKVGRDKAICYLAVVEQYLVCGKECYLVRGIIRGDINGYAIAFNPEYEVTIPKNIFEKYLRVSDEEDSLPEVYKKKKIRK